jgi:hypothetical protein
MIADIEHEGEGSDPGGDDVDTGRSEVLVIRVWRIGHQPGRLRSRLLRAGDQNHWTTTTFGITADPAELIRLVDAWLQEFLRD